MGDDTTAIDDLLSGGKSSLTEKNLSELVEKTKIEEASNLNVTEWRGKKTAIRNEKVRVFLLNYREFLVQIDAITSDEEKLEKFGEIIMECGESIELVKSELRQDASHRNALEKGIAPQSDLFAYLNFVRLQSTIGGKPFTLLLFEHIISSILCDSRWTHQE